MNKYKFKGMSVVLIGQFNPLMFHPSWFSKNNIISKEDEELIIHSKESKMIVSPGLTIFRTSDFELNITPNRFVVLINKEPFVMLKDLVLKTFEKLGTIPITFVGINSFSDVEFNCQSEVHEFADRLAPKNRWNSLLGTEVTGEERRSGLAKMIMTKFMTGYSINYSFESSNRLKHGIYVHCNFHYDLDQSSQFAEEALRVIEINFEESSKKMYEITEEIIKGDC